MATLSLISNSEQETKKCAQRFSRQLNKGNIIFLQGELGSGKTTFVKGLAKGLHGNPRHVNSPSFVLMNCYKGRLPIYHFDLYRIKTVQDLRTINFDDYFYDQGISVVEWPHVLGEIDGPHYQVEFKHKGVNKRTICISCPSKPQRKSSR